MTPSLGHYRISGIYCNALGFSCQTDFMVYRYQFCCAEFKKVSIFFSIAEWLIFLGIGRLEEGQIREGTFIVYC